MNQARFLLAILPLSLSGCIYYFPTAVSTNPVGTEFERPVDVVSGKSSAFYIFGFGPIGNDSLQAAVEDSLAFRRASTMSNVFVDRRMICVPFCGFSIITRIDTMVYGTLVSYSGDSYVGMGKLPSKDLMQLNEREIHDDTITLWNAGNIEAIEKLLQTANSVAVQKALGQITKEYVGKDDRSNLLAWLIEGGYVTRAMVDYARVTNELEIRRDIVDLWNKKDTDKLGRLLRTANQEAVQTALANFVKQYTGTPGGSDCIKWLLKYGFIQPEDIPNSAPEASGKSPSPTKPVDAPASEIKVPWEEISPRH